jgi:hypothetical protein
MIIIYTKVCGVLNQGFPFLPLQCRQGKTRMGGGGDSEEMCTLQTVTVWCFCGWQGLSNHSMRIQDLYVGTFPRFIRNISICCLGGDVYREGF